MGMSMKAEDFELCTRLENIALGKGGYFGLSAATGGLAGQEISFIFSSSFRVYVHSLLGVSIYSMQ